jgi:hypothetical protein
MPKKVTSKVKPDNVDKPVETPKVDNVDKIPDNIDSKLTALEQRLREYVDQRIEAMNQTTAQVDKVDVPPQPPKLGPSGKKLKGKKENIRALIDAELWKLFDSECREHHAGNQSRALDAILWRYFNRPRLSFEDK